MWLQSEYEASRRFEDFVGIASVLVQGLKTQGYVTARPIQAFSLKHILSGRDVLLRAPTGTGKTLCYLIPIISSMLSRRLQQKRDWSQDKASLDPATRWRMNVDAVVLVPSRELCLQVTEVIQNLVHAFENVCEAICLAGAPKTYKSVLPQARDDSTGFILVTNPAHFIKTGDLLSEELSKRKLLGSEPHACIFPGVKHLVIDEADVILEVYGFTDETSALFSAKSAHGKLVSYIHTNYMAADKPQVLICSATMNEELSHLNQIALYRPVVLNVTHTPPEEPSQVFVSNSEQNEPSLFGHLQLPSDVAMKIDHRYIVVNRKEEEDFLAVYGIIHHGYFNMGDKFAKTLVFCNDDKKAARLFIVLKALDVRVERATSAQSLATRVANIDKFNSGRVDVLIGTDSNICEINENAEPKEEQHSLKRRKTDPALISRGLDFRKVARVILMDIPLSVDDYVHKVGRTGRDFETSTLATALTLLSPSESEMEVWQEIGKTYNPTTPDDFTLDSFGKLIYRLRDKCRLASKGAIKQLLQQDR